jgi:hypothetical protein
MNANNEWQALLAGLDADDPAAVARRQREVDGDLVRIVGRILRTGTTATALARRVAASARRLAWEYPEEARDRQWLVHAVAGSVSRSLRVQAPAPLGGQAVIETVRV